MVENSNMNLSILLLFIVFENVEGRCSNVYNGYTYVYYCTYYNPYLLVLGASYGSVIGIGILVSFIVCWCCNQRKNQQGCHGAVIVPTPQRTNNIHVSHQYGIPQNQHPVMAGIPGTQNSYMLTPTHGGNSQGPNSPHVGIPSTSADAGENLPGTVQSGT
ncbi:uncharacterized protein LOC134231447 [Saccostrea cucullata]|uniref:uncharacterized protein LOC134231447 n=1 Tax=Saccostrea cuccullata TaxID=36930 RepID=UPI002ED55305